MTEFLNLFGTAVEGAGATEESLKVNVNVGQCPTYIDKSF